MRLIGPFPFFHKVDLSNPRRNQPENEVCLRLLEGSVTGLVQYKNTKKKFADTKETKTRIVSPT